MIFAHPILTPFPPGVSPNYSTIEKCQEELSANAQGIRSAAGGIFGHLAITVSEDEYLEITGDIEYVAPVNPGDTPAYIEDATQFQIAEANRVHLVNKKAYDVYCDVNLALKKQLLAACPDLFLEAMKQPRIGYGGRTILQLLTHLRTNYSKIEQSQLVENEKLMKTPWHTTEPIEKLFSQLKNTFAIAQAGNAGTTEITVVRIGYQIIMDTGMFKEDLRDWRKKDAAQWTMDNFTMFFKAANTDRMATTTDGGFHTANAATTSPNTLSTIATLQAENAQLKKSLASKKVTTKTPMNRTPPGTLSYCHTHGSSNNADHNSMLCTKKGPNHQDEATEDNKMGGSTRVWTIADRRQQRE